MRLTKVHCLHTAAINWVLGKSLCSRSNSDAAQCGGTAMMEQMFGCSTASLLCRRVPLMAQANFRQIVAFPMAAWGHKSSGYNILWCHVAEIIFLVVVNSNFFVCWVKMTIYIRKSHSFWNYSTILNAVIEIPEAAIKKQCINLALLYSIISMQLKQVKH